MRATLLAFVLLASAYAHPLANAADSDPFWPTFRGPERSGVSSETGLLAQWPTAGPPLVWKAPGAGRGYSSLAIADGRIYTLGDRLSTASDEAEYLACFDVEQGKQLWKTRLGQPWDSGPGDWQSSRSTPTIDGDRVYVLTPHGDVICCQTNSGEEQWRVNLKKEFGGVKGDGWGYSESVLIDGEKLVCTPGGGKTTLVALNKQTGKPLWKTVREGDRGAGHASIVPSEVGGMRIYVQTTASGPLGVRATDGKLLWSYPIEPTTAVIPTPIVRNDLVFFSAGYGRGGALLRQVPADSGEVKLEEIYPLQRNLANKHGGVVLVGDYLYGDSEDSGVPFCADFMTGKQQWKSRGSGSGSASVVAAEDRVYFRFSNGVMALIQATPEKYEEVSSFKIPDSGDRPSWSHPVIAGGRLFLREHDSVLCYDLRAK